MDRLAFSLLLALCWVLDIHGQQAACFGSVGSGFGAVPTINGNASNLYTASVGQPVSISYTWAYSDVTYAAFTGGTCGDCHSCCVQILTIGVAGIGNNCGGFTSTCGSCAGNTYTSTLSYAFTPSQPGCYKLFRSADPVLTCRTWTNITNIPAPDVYIGAIFIPGAALPPPPSPSPAPSLAHSPPPPPAFLPSPSPSHLMPPPPLPASPSSHSPLPPPLPTFMTTPPPPPPPPPFPLLRPLHPSPPPSPLVTPLPFTHTSGFIALIVIVAALALALLCGFAFWLFRRWRRSAQASKEPLTEQEMIDMLRARGLARLQQRDWRAAHQQPVAPEAPAAWRHTQQFAPAYEPSAPSLRPLRQERLQSPGEPARFRPPVHDDQRQRDLPL